VSGYAYFRQNRRIRMDNTTSSTLRTEIFLYVLKPEFYPKRLVNRIVLENRMMPLKLNVKEEAWFYISIIGYVSGIIFSYLNFIGISGKQSTLETAYTLLNTLSGGIIYFFIFASAGYLLQKRRLDKVWALVTILFYLFTVVYASMKLGLSGKLLQILTFPLVYGVYFPLFGINYLTELVSSAVEITPVSILLAILYNLATLSWFYLEFFGKKIQEHTNAIRAILLMILFSILTLGMISCVNTISSSSF